MMMREKRKEPSTEGITANRIEHRKNIWFQSSFPSIVSLFLIMQIKLNFRLVGGGDETTREGFLCLLFCSRPTHEWTPATWKWSCLPGGRTTEKLRGAVQTARTRLEFEIKHTKFLLNFAPLKTNKISLYLDNEEEAKPQRGGSSGLSFMVFNLISVLRGAIFPLKKARTERC